MQYGDGVHPDKRLARRGEEGAVYVVVGVRAIEYNYCDMGFGSGFHHVVHGADVGVEASADVLEIEENKV